MTKKRKNRAVKPSFWTIRKTVAAAIGIALTSVDTWMNIEYIWAMEKAISAQVAMVPLASIAAAAALPYAAWSFKKMKFFDAIGLSFLAVLLFAFSFSASLDRVGQSRDKLSRIIQVQNTAVEIAKNAVTSAKENKSWIQDQINAECSGKYSKNAPKTKGHRPGNGPSCRKWQTAIVLGQQGIDTAQKTLLKAKAAVTQDSSAIRISTILTSATGYNITVKNVQTYHPLILPLAMQLGGLLFIGIAFAPASGTAPTAKGKKVAPTVKPRDMMELLNLRKDKNGQVFIVQKNVMQDLDYNSPSKVSRELSKLYNNGAISKKSTTTIDGQRGTLITLA